MSALTEDQEAELKNVGAFMDNTDKNLSSVNIYQQWPIGRGVFVADDKSMIIHINAEDHCKFISIESCKDFGIIKWSNQLQNINVLIVTLLHRKNIPKTCRYRQSL